MKSDYLGHRIFQCLKASMIMWSDYSNKGGFKYGPILDSYTEPLFSADNKPRVSTLLNL